jgi:ribosomal protein L37AE/L43A
LDDNTIIVCEKWKMITNIDKFIWTCPKCEKKFKNGLGDNNNNLINLNKN